MEPTAVERASAPASDQASGDGPVAERVTAEHKLKVSHKDQAGKGRVGSLENPELYEEVPGHVIPIIEGEFDDFDTEAARFMRNEVPEDKFIGFRLKQGVYGQRQPDVQMIRVKLPLGGVTPEQMEAFADAIENYAPLRKGHITTRENIQIHHVPLPDAAKFIRQISDAGLSSREGCGNTIRNVTGDPWAGITEGELFDITPYAMAYVRYFVRHPVTQLMPRKVKTAFTATDEDVAITGIHDIGFIPRLRDGVRGAEIRVGGGTSIMPRIAPTLYDFVELENGDYLKVAEACWRIFDRQEWLRENRARARIKVLIDKVGIDAFREMVEEELRGDWVDEREFDVERLKLMDDEEAKAPPPPASYGSPNGDRSQFDQFMQANVRSQRQEGFSAVEVKVTRGDLTPEQLRGLAAIMREFSGGYARTTVQQNLVLRWVRDESVYDVWERLGELDLDGTGPREITDVVSCPGTDSCKLGITSSMGLNQAVQQRLEAMQINDPLTKRIHVKMSGCPNGCAQHHIANIGFYGASLKIGERQIPAYIAHLAGNYEGGEVVYGHRLKARLPAKRVPDAVERWVRFYESDRHDGEEFNDFVERVGTAEFEAQVKDLAMPVEFSLETLDQFIDWSRSEPYKVERGEGECAV
jgi:sulfite reductase (ferredoxin)